ncbi:hypothetical protein BGZ54_006646 [Gamsiella multidivaricata]|nr:hypothetical protein BGZ54_006646 [Gamsiella multidivaricata]
MASVSVGTVFPDISNSTGLLHRKSSPSAPRGRKVSYGTNVECQCDCTSGYRVICPREFGQFELACTTFQCPNCKEQKVGVVPVTVGFTKCKYRFHGIKASKEQYTSE